MNMKVIIYTNAAGTLCVDTPVINTIGDPDGFTEADAIARARARIPADALGVRVVEANEIPSDRTFRNAWKDGGRTIEHDLPKCRAIWREKLREARAPALAAFDVQYMLADERGDVLEKQRIATAKQKLRDVTADPAIEEAQTPEELKRVMPSALT